MPLVKDAHGHEYRPPVATMRAYLEGMDKAAAIAPPLDEPPPIVLAALGPDDRPSWAADCWCRSL